MERIDRVPADVAPKLGWYVYAYVNPIDGRIFYVGKGKGSRVLSHLKDTSRSRKVAMLNQLRSADKHPQLEILAHNLGSEEIAFQVEMAVIDSLGLDSLTNQVHGHHSSLFGRMPLHEVVAHYRKKPVRITHPAMLIRINHLYRPQMSPTELYDATRGVWRVDPGRARPGTYAFAVYQGIVREVYEILQWFEAGKTFSTRDPKKLRAPGRYEFVGQLAPEPIRRRYVDRAVSAYFARGAQNPIVYVET